MGFPLVLPGDFNHTVFSNVKNPSFESFLSRNYGVIWIANIAK